MKVHFKKIAFTAFVLFISTHAMADSDTVINILNKKVLQKPDNFFHNGVEWGEVAKLPDGSPSFSIKEEGYNGAGFLTNTTGQFVRLYSLYDSNMAFENTTLTFTFYSPNGAKNTFNCHAIHQINCGTIELINCSKSEFGYTMPFRAKQIITYDDHKKQQCENHDKKINQAMDRKLDSIKEIPVSTRPASGKAK